MLPFQTLSYALYIGFMFAMYGPREPRGLFLLPIAYTVGSFPKVEDSDISSLCQPLVCP